MYFLIIWSCFFVTTMLSSVHGSCSILDRVDGCQYTVHCLGTPGSVYSSNCEEHPNVTFVVENSNVRVLSLSFFSRTNFDQRVRQFKAIGNSWEFIEPNTFKYYRKSVSLDLSKNGIINLEKEAFNELTLLKQLNLSDNNIQELPEKSLQLSVVSENSLEVLDLSKNLITSIGSNVFSNLANLKILFLHDNQIMTLKSDCFSILRHLTYLTLYNNRITSLNTVLVSMGELKFLDISRNKINKLSGIDMIRLVSLTKLNMSQNAIETIEFNCLNQAFSLHTLDLSYNRLTTPFEKPILSYNSNLTYLNLYSNNITSLGDSTFKSTKLNYLNIENNKITGDITINTFEGLQKLTYLNITHQHITSIRNNAFSEMVNLQHLDLSQNDIGIVENSSFVNASALITLNLSYNSIKDLVFFKMFSSNLTEIYINNNMITAVPKDIFSNHSRLSKLDLSANKITVIEPNALSLNNIQYLNLKDNILSGILVDGVFSPAKLLKKLDLSHHNLKAINASAFSNLPLLESLDLSFNNIQYIDSNNFKGVDNMSILNVSNNSLTYFNIDGKFENLKALLLSYNGLASIPNILKFTNPLKLLLLKISYNNISNVTYPGFENFTNLLILDLSNNKISKFNNRFTNTLTSLVALNLESNHIKEINLTFFKNISHVNISNNDIAYIDESHFKNLENLDHLDLKGNKIKTISPGTFQHFASLKFLTLSQNNITFLRFGSFRGLNNTNVIDLSHNSIQTINVDIFHECYQLTKIIIDYNNISSINIERLLEVSPKLELISLGGNPIACEEIVKSTNKKFGGRNFQITSMHKIFHEDNVHGIRCGEINRNVTNGVTTEVISTLMLDKPESQKSESSSLLLVVWCSVISTLLIIGLGFLYWRHRQNINNNDTRMQFQNTVSTRNSECYSDLLN
ncbi:hypothetical protein ABMA27_005856 [Loxostege sticticalis]|uniref:Uncharacterized protein n=1 Tax=Loxostege sticticalis TaxID=481309 RepID=A0ABR3HGR5_LOXSC